MASKRERRTEIVDVEDGKQIFVYTEDNAILEKLRKKATRLQWYEQWFNLEPGPVRIKTVGVALYFPKNKRATLERQIAKLKGSTK